MQNLRMPAHYAEIPQQEQRTVQGGGVVSDALGNFFSNIELMDVVLGSSVLFVSFTFAPQLFFEAARVVFDFAVEITEGLHNLVGQLTGLRS